MDYETMMQGARLAQGKSSGRSDRGSSRSKGTREDFVEKARRELTAAGCFVIEAITENENGYSALVDCDFATFATYAKELGVRVVFVAPVYLEEAAFFTDWDEESGTDLREYDPGLKSFERYLGQCRTITATVCFAGGRITCGIDADWNGEFEEARDEAVERVEEKYEEQDAQRTAEAKHREEAVVERIRGLWMDDAFQEFVATKRATIASITAYIDEHVSEIQFVPRSVVGEQARALKAKALLESKG